MPSPMHTPTDESEQLVYVGFISPCGCAMAASVIEEAHRADNAKFCADLIRRGARVETRPLSWVRENLFCQDRDNCARPEKAAERRKFAALKAGKE